MAIRPLQRRRYPVLDHQAQRPIAGNRVAGFDEKAQRPGVESYQSAELTVASYPARVIVFGDEQGWHSEVVVNFGKDLGNETYSMYAAYLYFTGETYMSVWSDEIQGIVNSLTLTS